MFTTKLRVKMLTHNFLDKLEMAMRAVISSLSRKCADYHNDLIYIKSIILKVLFVSDKKTFPNSILNSKKRGHKTFQTGEP